MKNDWFSTIIGLALVIVFWWGIITFINNSNDTDKSQSYQDSQNSEYNVRESDPDTYYSSQGFDCTDDCSGHDAGYEWASENDICDEYYEQSNSTSFDEGVQSYAIENC
jgi:hypothetical protein